MKRRFFSGFALLEVLVMASLLVGLSAMIIVFSHQKQKEINARKVGKAIGYITNEFILQAAPGGTCNLNGPIVYGKGSYYKISDCIDIPDSIKTILEQNGINLDDLSLSKGGNADRAMLISIDENIDRKSSAIYAEEVFNSLSTTALNYLYIASPTDGYLPFSYDNYQLVSDGELIAGFTVSIAIEYDE